MMHKLKLYDPTRSPRNWTDLIHAGQYAVFHSSVETNVEMSEDGRHLQPGEDSTCTVFDSLAEAEAYCEAQTAQAPVLRCDIFDHTGKSRPPLLTYVNPASLRTPEKHATWGWILIAASLPCFWIELHWHGTLVVPMIVGINLIFGGLRFIHWGKGGTEKRRSSRES